MGDLIGIGKYSSDRDCILHFMCISDWANESFGDVSEYGYYVWRISNDTRDVAADNTEAASLIEQNGYGIEHTPDLAAELTGHFIVWESDSGSVNVRKYGTSSECVGAFNDWQAEYEASLGEDDE